MRSTYLFLLIPAVFAKEEIDCDMTEVIKQLWKGLTHSRAQKSNDLPSGQDIPKQARNKQEKAEAVCKAKKNAKKRISQHAAKSFLSSLSLELTKFNKNFVVS